MNINESSIKIFKSQKIYSPLNLLLGLFVVGIVFSIWTLFNGKLQTVSILGIVLMTLLFGYLWLLIKMGDQYLRYTLIFPSILTMLAVTLFPLCYLLYLSFFDVSLLNFNKDWNFTGLKNYLYFLTEDELFLPAVIRTYEYVIFALISQLVIGMGLALFFRKLSRGRALLSTILLVPVMASPVVVALLWKNMYDSVGPINQILNIFGIADIHWLTNTPLPLVSKIPFVGEFLIQHLNFNWGFFSAVVVNVWQWTPFVFLMFLAGLSSLPREPFEASKVDGANAWQTFWNVTVPLLKPVITVVVFIRIIDLNKVYDQIWVLFGTSVSMRTLNVHIFTIGLTSQNYSRGAALSIIVLLLVVLTYILFILGSNLFKKVKKR